jgi:hypothetical protein
MKKYLFLPLLFTLVFACRNEHGHEPYIFLPQKENHLSHLADELELHIETNMDFLFRLIGRCSWISYQKEGNDLYFKVEGNDSAQPRSCRFLVLNENCHVSDTITIIQSGKPSVVPPSDQEDEEDENVGGNVGDGDMDGDDSGRCAAITQKGTRCKRNAVSGSLYCWQHQEK